MTTPFKPLFPPRLLEDAERAFHPALDDEQTRIVASWAASAAHGTGNPVDQTHAVLELKAPGADLDAKQSATYGRLTPVEQAFGYAAKVDGCRWVLVSNFLELRLYRTDRGQGYGHRFHFSELSDPQARHRFLFLLARENLLGSAPDQPGPVARLATRTYTQEQQISKDFYVFQQRGLGRFVFVMWENNSSQTSLIPGWDWWMRLAFGLPGVNVLDAGGEEIRGIASDDCKTVVGGCGGDQNIRIAKGVPGFAALFNDQTPLHQDILRDGKHTILEHWTELVLQPKSNFSAALGLAQLFDTEADLGEGDLADE
jgi:hypothetical protein